MARSRLQPSCKPPARLVTALHRYLAGVTRRDIDQSDSPAAAQLVDLAPRCECELARPFALLDCCGGPCASSACGRAVLARRAAAGLLRGHARARRPHPRERTGSTPAATSGAMRKLLKPGLVRGGVRAFGVLFPENASAIKRLAVRGANPVSLLTLVRFCPTFRESKRRQRNGPGRYLAKLQQRASGVH